MERVEVVALYDGPGMLTILRKHSRSISGLYESLILCHFSYPREQGPVRTLETGRPGGSHLMTLTSQLIIE